MVEDARLNVPVVETAELLARLTALEPGEGQAVLAFDADGTLWSGDVGEELFEYAIQNDWLRAEAWSELARLAAAHHIDASGSAPELAARLFAAHRAGIVGDVPAFEMMTWAYAGWRPAEFEVRARAALRDLRLAERVQREVLPVLAWARERRVRVAVVSASPRLAVLAALEVTGIPVDGVAGGVARAAEGVIEPAMLLPLPYGLTKRSAALELFGDARWIASFGDSSYDYDLLVSAHIGVLVRPKPALLERAVGHPNLCVLRKTA